MNSFDVTAHMKPLRQSFSAILAWHCTNKKSIFPFIVNWGWKGWCKGCPQKSSLQNWKHEVCQYQNMQAQTDIPFSAPLMINSVMPVKANLDSENWEIVARGIRNPNNDWNQESKFKWKRLKPSTLHGRLIGTSFTSAGVRGKQKLQHQACELSLSRHKCTLHPYKS